MIPSSLNKSYNKVIDQISNVRDLLSGYLPKPSQHLVLASTNQNYMKLTESSNIHFSTDNSSPDNEGKNVLPPGSSYIPEKPEKNDTRKRMPGYKVWAPVVAGIVIIGAVAYGGFTVFGRDTGEEITRPPVETVIPNPTATSLPTPESTPLSVSPTPIPLSASPTPFPTPTPVPIITSNQELVDSFVDYFGGHPTGHILDVEDILEFGQGLTYTFRLNDEQSGIIVGQRLDRISNLVYLDREKSESIYMGVSTDGQLEKVAYNSNEIKWAQMYSNGQIITGMDNFNVSILIDNNKFQGIVYNPSVNVPEFSENITNGTSQSFNQGPDGKEITFNFQNFLTKDLGSLKLNLDMSNSIIKQTWISKGKSVTIESPENNKYSIDFGSGLEMSAFSVPPFSGGHPLFNFIKEGNGINVSGNDNSLSLGLGSLVRNDPSVSVSTAAVSTTEVSSTSVSTVDTNSLR